MRRPIPLLRQVRLSLKNWRQTTICPSNEEQKKIEQEDFIRWIPKPKQWFARLARQPLIAEEERFAFSAQIKLLLLITLGEFKGIFAYFRLPDLVKIVSVFSVYKNLVISAVDS